VWDLLVRRARIVALARGAPPDGLADGALAVEGGRIAWLGREADLPAGAGAPAEIDVGGGLVTPGLVDCHTHLVHAGHRAGEWARRLAGASYEDLAREGGGILSTVRATRAADEAGLLAASLPRLDALLADGVTTVEVKSGYGLERAAELKMLRVARALGRARRATVRTSFLGAHAVPPEYAGRADDWVAHLCEDVLPAARAEGLVDAVDAYLEPIAFSAAQVDRLFEAAARLGLPVRLHADQLGDRGGAALAARHRALSADHLEHASSEGIAALARAGTVAVLLPGALYFLRETRPPPVAALRAAGVPLAVATDLNPGTSPLGSLLAAMNMACTLLGLTPGEALAGATREAARALGLADRGLLAPGLRADLALWAADHPVELSSRIGLSPLVTRVVAGVPDHAPSA